MRGVRAGKGGTNGCPDMMHIRPATDRDVEAIALIYHEGMTRAPYGYDVPLSRALEAIEGYLKNWDVWVAEDENELVGFVITTLYTYIDGPRLWVGELFVKPAQQGQGVGRVLMEHVEAEYKSEGVRVIELLAHGRAAVKGFYEHLGYYESEQRKFEKKL